MSDIDIAVADSLKVLDLKRPIREATCLLRGNEMMRRAISRLMRSSKTMRAVARLFDHLIGLGMPSWRNG